MAKDDQKKYEQIMGDSINRQLYREWQQKYSPQAVRNFSRPAVTCELCGSYMHVNPQDGRNYSMDEWERKWSIHRYCAKLAEERLDRESNIRSRRQ